MLSCKNISCQRSGRTIFKKLSFDVAPGSALILKGPNGSGKTSLLKIISGVIKPHSGTVEYGGKPINKIQQQYSKDIQYIGHRNTMHSEFTVEQNLDFWAELNDSIEAVPPAIMYFNLAEEYDVKYKYLSEGQKRRTALAKLLCCPTTKLWLLDEPTTNLDSASSQIFTNIVNTKIEQQGIVIISSHQEMKIKNSQELDISLYGVEE